ncbi:hypothetical protein KSP39_PZI019877 [Platanthera zijinensis]|uniref:50S ribosomal protein 6, chloroplastic n=1 Tax=Platanthera zijinensis TaxID=2320716 RepID=A0AAP0B0Z9_9ASPA
MATLISAVLVGVPPAKFKEGKQAPVTWVRDSGVGGDWVSSVKCSSRPQKKGTAHHMKTRPKKTQPWDVKRKGPTLYPSLPALPPDWTLATSDDGGAKESAAGTVVEASSLPVTAVTP